MCRHSKSPCVGSPDDCMQSNSRAAQCIKFSDERLNWKYMTHGEVYDTWMIHLTQRQLEDRSRQIMDKVKNRTFLVLTGWICTQIQICKETSLLIQWIETGFRKFGHTVSMESDLYLSVRSKHIWNWSSSPGWQDQDCLELLSNWNRNKILDYLELKELENHAQYVITDCLFKLNKHFLITQPVSLSRNVLSQPARIRVRS